MKKGRTRLNEGSHLIVLLHHVKEALNISLKSIVILCFIHLYLYVFNLQAEHQVPWNTNPSIKEVWCMYYMFIVEHERFYVLMFASFSLWWRLNIYRNPYPNTLVPNLGYLGLVSIWQLFMKIDLNDVYIAPRAS